MSRAETLKSPWKSGRDRAAEREEKRNAVLHVAAVTFAEKGYHGTSLDEIAARLGVTKPTIYYYAPNKDELVIAVAERALHQIIDATEGDQRASGLIQLQHLMRRYAETMTTDEGRCLAVMRGSRINGVINDKLRDYVARIDRRMRELVERGVADGSIAPCDTKLTAFMIAGAINEIGRWYDAAGPLNGQLVAEKFVNQLTAGLATR